MYKLERLVNPFNPEIHSIIEFIYYIHKSMCKLERLINPFNPDNPTKDETLLPLKYIIKLLRLINSFNPDNPFKS